MKYFVVFLTIFLTVSSAYAENTAASECKNSAGFLPDALIATEEGPCIQPPCKCIPGAPIYLYVNFTAPYYLDKIKPKVVATVLGIAIPYPLTQSNACDGITNTYCPVIKGEPVNYYYQMDLFSSLPKISLSIEFSILDEHTGEDIVCFYSDLIVDDS